MNRSLVRGRTVLTRPIGREMWEQIDNGAVYQTDGLIRDIGPFAELRARYPDAVVIGDDDKVILPGFVNAHHHVGLTPFQLGAPDMANEFWGVARMVSRSVDPYLDTLYSAFELIASGVTTVQHIRPLHFGTQRELEDGSDAIIRAYADVGMRVSFSINARDQNRLVMEDDSAFVARLPKDLQPLMSWYFSNVALTLDQYFETFDALHSRYSDRADIRIQLAPANLHWLSDEALARFARASESRNLPMHMHLLETPYQREYAHRRGIGAVDYIDRFGLLGPRMTLGHAVWTSEPEIDRIAESGTHICHNCSSNFRIRSGVAPLMAFEERGINIALGIDEAGLNDDRDMLQEMRLVLRAHRMPSPGDEAPTPGQVLRMATLGGALTTPFGDSIGTIEIGRAADLVLVSWDDLAYPFLDPLVPVVDAIVNRAKASAICAVMVAGRVIYEAGRFTLVDQEAVLKALHDDMKRVLTHEETEKRRLSELVMPYVRQFYRDHVKWGELEPYYRPNSRW